MTPTAPRRTRIKICGLTTPAAARVAVEAGADAIGLVFAADSPRRIDGNRAAEIRRALPPFVTAVGVFAPGPRPEAVEDLAGPRAWCQVHGPADDATLTALAAIRPVIRGFRFDPAAVRRWQTHPAIDALLVDGSAGGAGTGFDHTALAALRAEIEKPVILAGGLTPENVGQAIRTVRPFAVDVSTGVESAPGVKDRELVYAFCAAVREADEEATKRRSDEATKGG